MPSRPLTRSASPRGRSRSAAPRERSRSAAPRSSSRPVRSASRSASAAPRSSSRPGTTTSRSASAASATGTGTTSTTGSAHPSLRFPARPAGMKHTRVKTSSRLRQLFRHQRKVNESDTNRRLAVTKGVNQEDRKYVGYQDVNGDVNYIRKYKLKTNTPWQNRKSPVWGREPSTLDTTRAAYSIPVLRYLQNPSKRLNEAPTVVKKSSDVKLPVIVWECCTYLIEYLNTHQHRFDSRYSNFHYLQRSTQDDSVEKLKEQFATCFFDSTHKLKDVENELVTVTSPDGHQRQYQYVTCRNIVAVLHLYLQSLPTPLFDYQPFVNLYQAHAAQLINVRHASPHDTRSQHEQKVYYPTWRFQSEFRQVFIEWQNRDLSRAVIMKLISQYIYAASGGHKDPDNLRLFADRLTNHVTACSKHLVDIRDTIHREYIRDCLCLIILLSNNPDNDAGRGVIFNFIRRELQPKPLDRHPGVTRNHFAKQKVPGDGYLSRLGNHAGNARRDMKIKRNINRGRPY